MIKNKKEEKQIGFDNWNGHGLQTCTIVTTNPQFAQVKEIESTKKKK